MIWNNDGIIKRKDLRCIRDWSTEVVFFMQPQICFIKRKRLQNVFSQQWRLWILSEWFKILVGVKDEIWSAASRSIRSSGGRSSRSGMRALVDALSETRPKSPAGSQVDNEEPIELAHYPDAMKPPPGAQPPIERDDFPAPPYPYTDPERRRRWSDSYKVLKWFVHSFCIEIF